MTKVTVTPINTIAVKVNQTSQEYVSTTNQFVGSAGDDAAQALAIANQANTTATQAIQIANEAIANVHTDRLINTSNTASVILDNDGAFNLVPNGRGVLRNSPGNPINIVSDNFAQLQWTTDVNNPDPNSTANATNWVYVGENGLAIENGYNTPTFKGWYFQPNGTFLLPNASTINDDSGFLSLNSANGLELNMNNGAGQFIVENGAIYLKAGLLSGATSADWTFFSDGTIQWPNGEYQTGAASPIAYTQAAFDKANSTANSVASNTASQAGINNTQNTWINNTDSMARGAYGIANLAFTGLITANQNSAIQAGINSTQNTWINNTDSMARGAYGVANLAFSGLITANQNTAIIQGVDLTQNTWINNTDSMARGAYGVANLAFSGLITANQNTATLQSQVSIIQGVDTTQNTRISSADALATAAYGIANLAFTGLITANQNSAIQSGINSTQNTWINNTDSIATGAYARANLAFTGLITANQNTAIIQGVDLTQNTRISSADALATGAYGVANLAFTGLITANANTSYLQGVNTTQNTRISSADALATGAYGIANLAFTGLITANANTAYIRGVDNTQNTNIASADALARNAYTNANVGYSFVTTGGTVTGNVIISRDLTVSGNLTVLGNSTVISSSQLDIGDSLIYLANNNLTSDTVDIGIIGHYDDGVDSHTGIFRDPNLKEWIFFKGYTPEVQSNNLINIAHPSFAYANLRVDVLKSSNGIVFPDGTTQLTAGSSVSNTIYLQGVNNTQNTNIASADTLARNAYGVANLAFTGLITANQNTAIIQGVDLTQNTRISSADALATGAYGVANLAFSGLITANANTMMLMGINSTQNTRITYADDLARSAYAQANGLLGVETTQNTNILNTNSIAQGAYNAANTAGANTVYLQNNLNLANGNIQALFALSNYANNTFFKSSGGTINGSVTITNNLSVAGNINFTGNVSTIAISGNTGQFFGYAANGFNALYAGVPTGYVIVPNEVAQFTGSNNSYTQINFQNLNGGPQATTDWIATANNGTDTTYYVDLGIAGSGYDNSSPNNSLGTSLYPNDSYLYAQGALTSGQPGGNLVIGAITTDKVVKVIAGGHDEENVVTIFDATNVNIPLTTPATSNTSGALIVSGGVGISGNLWAANAWVRGMPVLTEGDLSTTTYTANYITMNPALVPVPNVGMATSKGVYNFGNVASIQTYGDYDVNANTGFYSVNDEAFANGSPAHVEYIGFTGVSSFNRVVLNINYTASSGHTQDIDIFNYTSNTWDTLTQYSGSGNWQQFTLGVIDDRPYINTLTGNVTIRNYHVSSGNTQHRTWIDYVAIEQSLVGGQGPRGATGATGATGPAGSADPAAFDKANSANVLAQSAYNTANNALPNTGPVITVNSSSVLYVSNTSNSSSANTGALIVAGGVGVSGNVYIKGPNAVWAAVANSNSYQVSMSLNDTLGSLGVGWGTTAFPGQFMSMQATGGRNLISSVGRDFYILHNAGTGFYMYGAQTSILLGSTEVSTSNATGALRVSGGMGVSGNVYLSSTSRLGYANSNSVSVVYTVYNQATNSLDTIFG